MPELNWHKLRVATGIQGRPTDQTNRFKDWTRDAAIQDMNKIMRNHRNTEGPWEYLLDHNRDLLPTDDGGGGYETADDTTESDDSDHKNKTGRYTRPPHGRDWGADMPLMGDEGVGASIDQQDDYEKHRKTRRR